jgi:hypothetical protein
LCEDPSASLAEMGTSFPAQRHAPQFMSANLTIAS